jgi:hypothetical protein
MMADGFRSKSKEKCLQTKTVYYKKSLSKTDFFLQIISQLERKFQSLTVPFNFQMKYFIVF